jgi:hypothetical protein
MSRVQEWKRAINEGVTYDGYTTWLEKRKAAERQAELEAAAPLNHELRRALFGAMNDAFDYWTDDTRYNLTAAILGPDAPTSWSRAAGMTNGQARHILNVLNVVGETD